MQEIGRVLREKRIERGIEISDVARRTRIRDYYLKAIEEGNADLMPGIYYRGYLRLYASFLSIDAQALLALQEQAPILEGSDPDVLEPAPDVVVPMVAPS